MITNPKKEINYRILCAMIQDDINGFIIDLYHLEKEQKEEMDVEIWDKREGDIIKLKESIQNAKEVILKHKHEHPEYFI